MDRREQLARERQGAVDDYAKALSRAGTLSRRDPAGAKRLEREAREACRSKVNDLRRQARDC